MGAVAVAESDPNVVYVGMGEHAVRGVMTHQGDGVYRSTDAGKTWKHIGLEPTQHISRIVVHPKDPNTVFVAAQGMHFTTHDGRQVIDGISSLWCVGAGHNRKPINEAIKKQLALLAGVPATEVAITRNTTESLGTVIHGIDLEPGDLDTRAASAADQVRSPLHPWLRPSGYVGQSAGMRAVVDTVRQVAPW